MKLFLRTIGVMALGVVNALIGMFFAVLTIALAVRMHWESTAVYLLIFVGTVLVAGGRAFLIARGTHGHASLAPAIIGSLVAIFFCWSCGEIYEIGSSQWIIRGGLYGAMWGTPVAAILAISDRLVVTPSYGTDER